MIDQPNNLSGDERLDRILDGALASYTPAGPRFGFEDRLRARIAEETVVVRRPVLSLPWVWVAPVLLVAALAFAAIYFHRQLPRESEQLPGPATGPVLAGANTTAQDNSHLPRPRALPATAKQPEHKNKPVSAIDQVALQEMRAPSHPAPEEPLTQEEKLLLRVVHRGDSREMAILNPEVRAKNEAEDEAEFRQFVEQSNEGERE
jgi:hypothetical protein